ncbi:unnamed protein product [Alopecurus aequalis]
MQKSHTSSCPTITYEEALKRELEYRKRLESTHPHLLIGLNGAPVLPKPIDGMFGAATPGIPAVSSNYAAYNSGKQMAPCYYFQKGNCMKGDKCPFYHPQSAGNNPEQEICTDSTPDLLKRKSFHESNTLPQQSSYHFNAARSQPANWHPSKKKVIVRQPSSQAVQIPRTNSVPSFWCKICKVDCVTEFNFGSHIGGKKHQAKKLQILGNRNTGRPGSQYASNMNRRPSENAVSESRNDEPNVASSSIAGPSENAVSESRNDEPNVASSSIAGPSSFMSSGSRPGEADPAKQTLFF